MEESVSFIQNPEIHIEFFLKKRGIIINDLKNISNNWELYFFRFNELNESELDKYLAEDRFYIEGAMYIAYYGKELIGFKHWDLIDQLCAYFINSIYEITIKNKEFDRFYFPDQPVEVTLTKEKELISIKIGHESPVFLHKDIFIKAFLNACKNFYERIDGNSYRLEIQKIEEIRKYLK